MATKGDSSGASGSDKKEGEEGSCKNFLRQFRDTTSREFKKFTATQFMDVWNHYDHDGEINFNVTFA